MSFDNRYDNVGSIQTRQSIPVDDIKARLSSVRNQDDIIANREIANFHTFWKNEENPKSIREARGIYIVNCIITEKLIFYSHFIY